MKTAIATIITIIVFLIVTIFIKSKQDAPFNTVTLNQYIEVISINVPAFYDTIVNVAVSQTEISNAVVYVSKLSESAKNQFNGQLKAHLRYSNGYFYLFIDDNLDRKEAIQVISHEVIHMLQYESGDIIYEDVTGTVLWKGQTYTSDVDYDSRPWEKEAFENQSQIQDKVFSILY